MSDRNFSAQKCPAAPKIAHMVAIEPLENRWLLSGASGLFVGELLSVGDHPASIVSGDFNRDGIPDLVSADSGTEYDGSGQGVSILMGDGPGTFATAVDLGVHGTPASIATGDFNRDSKLDLAIANSSGNNVLILLGKGNGTFGLATAFGVGNDPASIVAADFNEDGKTDLATTNYGSGGVSILLGNGNGTFGVARSFALATSRCIRTADFNRDGKTDLAILGGEVLVLLGRGNGTFADAIAVDVGWGVDDFTTADFNGDGKVDLAAASYGTGNMVTVLGKGNGRFATAKTFAVGIDVLPNSIVAADFNGDGKTDLATAKWRVEGKHHVSILLGRGNGTFRASIDSDAGRFPSLIMARDFNGDGKADLLTMQSTGPYTKVSIVFGTGDGHLVTAPRLSLGGTPRSVTAADFNADGRVDLATANGDNISILLNHGNGAFAAPVDMPNFGADTVIAADFNQDGKMDLVGAGQGTVGILLGRGDGSFISASYYFVGGIYLTSIVAADLNRDGKVDLAASSYGEYYHGEDIHLVSVFLGKGDGTFASGPDIHINGLLPVSINAADYNGDGKIDLAFADEHGVSVLRGRGDGTFAREIAAAVFSDPPTAVVTADLNGDGKPDLAVAHMDSAASGYYVVYKLTVLVGGGNGTFFRSADYRVGSFPRSIVAADLNGDGKVDMATSNFFSHDLSVLMGHGNGTFEAKTDIAVGTSPISAAAADLNGDGQIDLVAANYDDFDLSVLLNRSVPTKGMVVGKVYRDRNANHVPDGSEPGLKGWLVYADINRDGRLNYNEPRAVTDFLGRYALANVPAGRQLVRLLPQSGWKQTQPLGGGPNGPTVLSGLETLRWDFGVIPIS